MSLGHYPPEMQFGWSLAMLWTVSLLAFTKASGYQGRLGALALGLWVVGGVLLMFVVGPWIHAKATDRGDT